MNHEPTCGYEISKNFNEKWRSQWPKHCKKCGGWGGFTHQYDPSPSGIGLSSGWMIDFEPCSSCTEEGLCSRCGYGYDGSACPSCGWEFNDGLKPEECYCWENDIPEEVW